MSEASLTSQPLPRESQLAELERIELLRGGDEVAFGELVDRHHATLVRLALQYVASASVAEEVAQETWIAFVQSLDRFEGRSSVKTWLFRTMINCARNRRRKEVHSVPFSALFDPEESVEPAVDPSQFRTEGPWAGHWAVAPRSFGEDGERELLRGELRTQLQAAVDALPAAQREVIALRDIEGFSAAEVCDVLGVTEANQRVLLHRARARVRAEIEAYLQREEVGA
jgi:RNA polymerase sigma-70 factor (ECF subfamily)